MVGPRVRVAMASWISPECDDSYHAFLQDEPEDCRTKVMALSLKDNFGTRFEPLLVLPDLLDEAMSDGRPKLPAAAANRRSQLTVLSEILACGHVRQLQLYGVAVPAKADPDESWAVPAGLVPGTVRERIERLRAVTADLGADAIETRVIEATPELPAFGTVYNNALCHQFVSRLAPRLREQGLTCNSEALAAAISGVLEEWSKGGILLDLPLRTDHLDAVTELVYKRLL